MAKNESGNLVDIRLGTLFKFIDGFDMSPKEFLPAGSDRYALAVV